MRKIFLLERLKRALFYNYHERNATLHGENGTATAFMNPDGSVHLQIDLEYTSLSTTF
jgi:hypothetical protein